MYIDLTDREIELLKQYKNVYKDERNIDCTSNPIVLVQDKIKRYTKKDYNYDGVDYVVDINEYCINEDTIFTSEEEVIESIRDYFSEENEEVKERVEEIIDDLNIDVFGFCGSDNFEEEDTDLDIKIEVTCHYYEYVWKTKAYFFTRAEAEKYVKYQGHNLSHPRVYTDYAGYSNDGDFPVFQKLLLRMGEELNNGRQQEIEKEWGEKITNIILEDLEKCKTEDECMKILNHYNRLFGWSLARRGSRRVPMKNISLQVEEDLYSYVRKRFGV